MKIKAKSENTKYGNVPTRVRLFLNKLSDPSQLFLLTNIKERMYAKFQINILSLRGSTFSSKFYKVRFDLLESGIKEHFKF